MIRTLLDSRNSLLYLLFPSSLLSSHLVKFFFYLAVSSGYVTDVDFLSRYRGEPLVLFWNDGVTWLLRQRAQVHTSSPSCY